MRPNRWSRREAGFSLIELLVAMTVTTIMMAVTLPAMGRYLQTQNLLGAMNNMAADFRLCRQRATAESNNVIMSWNTGAGTYTMLDDDNNNGGADAGEAVVGPKQLPDNVVLANNESNPFAGTTVTFLPDGSTSQGGTLKLTNSQNLVRRLTLVRPSGLVKVQ